MLLPARGGRGEKEGVIHVLFFPLQGRNVRRSSSSGERKKKGEEKR